MSAPRRAWPRIVVDASLDPDEWYIVGDEYFLRLDAALNSTAIVFETRSTDEGFEMIARLEKREDKGNERET